MKTLSIPALACALTLGFGLASAQAVTPTRVGPVSQYGQLITGKNSAGEGHIYGSCEGVKDGAEVQVRGMNIQIVRAAMATGSEDWNGEYNGQKLQGYGSNPTLQKNLMKTVVEAAIKQDIYVIIDWHSHNANNQTEASKAFFQEMAQTYGQYDNVIFELFNEPEDISWSIVKDYANQVIPTIRQYSDNLILVGNPRWDQKPHWAARDGVTDSGNNTAYTMHFYAVDHCIYGTEGWGDGDRDKCPGQSAEDAIKAGSAVFVSEWGTGDKSGGGYPDATKNQNWQEFINKYKLSWANWSASHISEGTAAFSGSSNKNSLQYSASGDVVKGYLATNPTTYTKCGTPQAIRNLNVATGLSVSFSHNALEVSGVNAATVELFDLNGNKLMMVDGVVGTLSLAKLPKGMYIAKVSSGSASKTLKVSIKSSKN